MSGKNRPKESNILLVGINAENEALLEDIVSEKYEVTKVSAENALKVLYDKSNSFSAAIINRKDALSILKEIRSNPEYEKFPVLISTDIDNAEDEEELLQLEVLDFLKFPFNKSRVLNRLKTAIKLSEANRVIDELERDELTGLLTRKAFLRKVSHVINDNREKSYCIIAFDFDNFKSSNSLYGVEKCNEFLAYTAHEMMKAQPEGISGRYGGDQYILFFDYEKNVNIERLNTLTKKILDTAPIPHQIVKMGVYSPIDTDAPLVINCDRAFLAISEIKGKYGKNLAFFEDDLQNHLLNEQRIIETMERGLEENQFQVFYQPKHETVTGHIAGAEALVRWNHPEYGFMAPNQFIPLFERNGFITKLDFLFLNRFVRILKDGSRMAFLLFQFL